MTKQEITQHYRANFGIQDSRLAEGDRMMIEWAEDLLADQWISIEDRLPDNLETVWISNGKGWTTLGCLVYAEGGRHWAETNGVIYQEEGKIVSECESDDLDVKFWQKLPSPPSTI